MDPTSSTADTNSESEGFPPALVPSDRDVAEALERILASEQFGGAARQQRLLRHLVSKHLSRTTRELKEYTLGVEVFDRGDDFDPRLDPIVRVEASRLRSRLQKYYDGPGSGDRIRISLPRGAYLPAFAFAPAAPSPGAGPTTESVSLPAQTAASSSQQPTTDALPPVFAAARKPLWLYAVVAALAIACVFLVLSRRSHRGPSPAPAFSHFRRLTNSEVSLSAYPTFSPDGKHLAFARKEGGRWILYLRDLDSLALTELTPDVSAGDCYQPAWSPDGARIAFRSDREAGRGLYLLDARTRAASQLTSYGYYPAWSPDGTKVVFSSEMFNDPVERSWSGDSYLSIVDVKTHQIKKVPNAPSVHNAMQPVWAPDGGRIAFWGTDLHGDRDIWSIPAPDGNSTSPAEPVSLVHDAWTDWSPAWAPDGRYIYFSSDRGGSMNLWRVAVNQGSGEAQGVPAPVTTPSSYSGWASFAPSGKEFAYVHRTALGELYKAPFTVDRGVQFDHSVQLTSGERDLHEPEISPDGGSLLVRVQDPQEDLAILNPDGTSRRRLTNDRFSDRNAHWFPDGQRILFTSNRSGTMQLWSIQADGTGLSSVTKNGILPTVFTPDAILMGFPPHAKPFVLLPPGAPLPNLRLPPMFRPVAWSPDRRFVAGRIESSEFGAGSMFIFTPGTNDFWEIASSANYPSAIWLQNGTQLLFSRDDGIFLADVPKHEIRSEMPAQHSTDVHSRFTLSRDNTTVYFVMSDDQEDIWIGS